MTDPLSPLASGLTVIGSAAESIRHLLKFYRQFAGAPAQVQRWLKTLRSLHFTITKLQECSTSLDSKYRFPPHFQQRLFEFAEQLQACVDEVARFDVEADKIERGTSLRLWNGKAKRSWKRFRWIAIGAHEMRQLVDVAKLYHFEFSMELLNLLLIAQTSSARPVSDSSLEPRNETEDKSENKSKKDPEQEPENESRHEAENGTERHSALQQQSPPTKQAGEIPKTRAEQETELTLLHTQETCQSIPVQDRANITRLMSLEYSKAQPLDAPRTPTFWPQQSLRTALFISWSFLICKLLLRAGPASMPQSRSQNISKRRGFGLAISLSIPDQWFTKLELALYIIHSKVASQNRIALSWELDFPRIIPSDSQIFEFARNGCPTDVDDLIHQGRGSVKDCSPHGITLLHIAARKGNLNLLKYLLLQRGANVNTPDEDGETPLHAAMGIKDNYDIARTLLENGADLYSRAIDGKTPLHCIFNNTIAAVLQQAEYIEGEEEDTLPDSEHMSISHFIAWSSRSTSAVFQRARICDVAGLWSVDIQGRTCLHLAASRGNLEVVSYLLESAPLEEVRRADFRGGTPMHYAVQSSSRAVEVMELLIACGADPRAKDDEGRTVLDWAAEWNNLVVSRKLMPSDGREDAWMVG